MPISRSRGAVVPDICNTPPKADPVSAGHHGGDVWGASRSLERPVEQILDLSASLNPLGPPPGLREVILDTLDRVCHYPDRGAHELREALGAWLGLQPGCILCGNGSTALIQLLTRSLNPEKTVIFSPAFGEFYRALDLHCWDYVPHYLSESRSFVPSDNDLQAAWSHDADCLIMTNPISPSGALVPEGILEAAFSEAKKRNAWLILDEAFIDFAPDAARSWAPNRIMQYPRLVVLRSLTKFYCLAGLRLGFVMCHPQTMQDLTPWAEPWSVNTLAQAAGAYCVRQEQYAKETRQAVTRHREAMIQRLEALGMQLYPSEANYLLMKTPEGAPTAKELAAASYPHGVLLRDCASFEGCGERHLRIAVCGPQEQERLFSLLERLLA
jgi:threonine-phosphate decarboxylase